MIFQLRKDKEGKRKVYSAVLKSSLSKVWFGSLANSRRGFVEVQEYDCSDDAVCLGRSRIGRAKSCYESDNEADVWCATPYHGCRTRRPRDEAGEVDCKHAKRDLQDVATA